MRYHQDIRQPPGSQYLCLTRRDTLISPPSALPSPHFRMHPFTSSPTPKPVTHVTRYHQTSPTPIKNYGFPKTDAPVTSVTIPFRFLLPSRGKRGCRSPRGGPSAHSSSKYSANLTAPTLLINLLHPSNPTPTQPAPEPYRPPLLSPVGVEHPGPVSTSPLTARRPRL